jgi:uncharacterized protein (DUF58 family)
MRRIILNRMLKRAAWGFAFLIASWLAELIGLYRFLGMFSTGIPMVDFFYVLFVAFLPQIIASIGYGILISVAFIFVKYKIFPPHRLERSYMGIKRSGLRRSALIAGIIAALLFVAPYFLRNATNTGMFIDGAGSVLTGIVTSLGYMGEYAGPMLQSIAAPVFGILSILVLGPLTLFYDVRVDAFLCSLFLAALFYHTTMVGMSSRSAKVERSVSRHLCQDMDKVVLKTKMTLPLPAPNVNIKSGKPPTSPIKGWSIDTKKNMSFTVVENKEEFTMQEGYYNFDMVPIRVSTLPFLRTTIYKVCAENADVSVVPRLKYKTAATTRKPSLMKETGSLIRKQLGSSLDFAGIRHYNHGDPLSRIWWKGLAKSGKMLVKEFHSFGEDRWMLVMDFSNPNMKEADIKSRYRFARLFIELCARKDIAVGLSSFSPNFHFTNYSTSKKDLMSSLTRMTSPLYEVSAKGTELILKDALGSDMEKLKRKCRKKKITLPMVYSYSGFGKRTTMLSWKGKSVFDSSMKDFFVKLRRSGKIVLVTDGGKDKRSSLLKFKTICENRHCIYVVVLTSEKPEMRKMLRDAGIKTISVPTSELATPAFVFNLVRMV